MSDCLGAGCIDGGQPAVSIPALEQMRRQAPEQTPLCGCLQRTRPSVVCSSAGIWRMISAGHGLAVDTPETSDLQN